MCLPDLNMIMMHTRRWMLGAGWLAGMGAGCGRGRFTDSERRAAVLRGFRFIRESARQKENFAKYGADYLWCFCSLSAAAAEGNLKWAARRTGEELARQWRREHPMVAPGAGVGQVTELAFGAVSAEMLGSPDGELKAEIRKAVSRFTAEDFLWFDPAREAVPEDIPQQCGKCKRWNARGKRGCGQCGAKLEMMNRYDILCDALITAYSGELYGVRLGGSYADVAGRVKELRPYRWKMQDGREAFESMAYAITHLVYTLNHYGLYRLRREWLPQEFEFLRGHILANIEAGDVETLGEFVDTLRAFGVGEADADLEASREYVLRQQKGDGGWGEGEDAYLRYHSTWTSIGALMEIEWRGEAVSYPEALKVLL